MQVPAVEVEALFDSDLTDLESSDEDGQDSSSAAEYKLDHKLKPPRNPQYSTRSLRDMITNGEIDLDADYQRDFVWTETRQIKIIDSLLRNYYIPPVVFNVKEEPDGSEKRICVDGKQRLTSICKFMEGSIPHQDKLSKKKYWYKLPKNATSRTQLLPKSLRNAFDLIQITCAEYSDLTPADERETFQRVQLGMALTTAEKWQALQGPWPDFLRELRDSYFSKESPGQNILSCISWDSQRAKDFQDLVRIVLTVDAAVVTEYPIITSNEKIETILKNESPPSPKLRAVVVQTFQKLFTLVKDPRYKKAFTGKVAPVELVMSAVLIAKRMGIYSDQQLADAIEAMRDHTRQTNAKGYIMWKPKLINPMWEFINAYKPPGKVLSAASPSKLKGTKRKTAASDDDGSDIPLAQSTRKKAKQPTRMDSGSTVVEPPRTSTPSTAAPSPASPAHPRGPLVIKLAPRGRQSTGTGNSSGAPSASPHSQAPLNGQPNNSAPRSRQSTSNGVAPTQAAPTARPSAPCNTTTYPLRPSPLSMRNGPPPSAPSRRAPSAQDSPGASSVDMPLAQTSGPSTSAADKRAAATQSPAERPPPNLPAIKTATTHLVTASYAISPVAQARAPVAPPQHQSGAVPAAAAAPRDIEAEAAHETAIMDDMKRRLSLNPEDEGLKEKIRLAHQKIQGLRMEAVLANARRPSASQSSGMRPWQVKQEERAPSLSGRQQGALGGRA